MVADPRTPARAGQLRTLGNPQQPYPAEDTPGDIERAGGHGLRSLNRPCPIRVAGTRPGGAPVAIIEGRTARRVAAVADEWWVEDEWWREPIARHYFHLQLADDRLCTVYHDTIAGTWHAQAY